MPAKRIPVIGDIVLQHTADGDLPVLVTAVAEDGTFSGQAFLAGTERAFVENIDIGKDEGQASFKD